METTPEPTRPDADDAVHDREGPDVATPGRRWLSTVVRYGVMSWVGTFTYRPGAFGRPGAFVVIQTERGIELGEQVNLCCPGHPLCVREEQLGRYIESSGQDFCRPDMGRILREATGQDIDEHRRLNAHVQDDIEQCAAAATEFNLDMKVVTAEHLLGGERIIFYFRSEGRVDFRDLVKELARRYRTRIEMRQVGARDEARLVADWEVCGRECCCKNFLKSLRPVNMKMAKLQKSTLDPAKVSGRCGRLRCCLRYENEGYQDLVAKLPRRGSRIRAAMGEGVVVDQHVLTQLVTVRTDDEKIFTVPLEEITAFDLPRPPPSDRPVAPAVPGRERGSEAEVSGADRRRPRLPRVAPGTVVRPPDRPRSVTPGDGERVADTPMATPAADGAEPAPHPADRSVAPPLAGPAPSAPPGDQRPRNSTSTGGGGPQRRRGRRRRRSGPRNAGEAPPSPGS